MQTEGDAGSAFANPEAMKEDGIGGRKLELSGRDGLWIRTGKWCTCLTEELSFPGYNRSQPGSPDHQISLHFSGIKHFILKHFRNFICWFFSPGVSVTRI